MMKSAVQIIQVGVLLAVIVCGLFATARIHKLETRVSLLEQGMQQVPAVASDEAQAATRELEQKLQRRIFLLSQRPSR